MKDNVDFLIDRVAIPNEHLLLSRLKDLKSQGLLGADSSDVSLRSLLSSLLESGGVIPNPSSTPSEIADYLTKQNAYLVMTPMELDDVASFFREEEEAEAAAVKAEEEEKRRREAETRLREEERKAEQARLRRRLGRRCLKAPLPSQQQQTLPRSSQSSRGKGSIYLGKELDREQLLSSIARRVQEKELDAQVKTIGEYSLDSDEIISQGLVIVGSSGSRSQYHAEKSH